MRKRNYLQKLFILAILSLMFTLVLGMTALAASKTSSLRNNKWYTDKSYGNKQTVYHKIKVTKPGLISVSGYRFSTYTSYKWPMGIRLCNSRKKELDTFTKYTSGSNSSKQYYCVKKGTYYIKTNDSSYKLKYSFKAISDKSGSKQSNANNLPRNKTAQGTLLLGESPSKSDWYKIVLPAPQRISLTYGALANNNWIEFKIVSASPYIRIDNASTYRVNSTKTETTQSVFPAGVYYIQVFREGYKSACNGSYTLKWK